MCRYTYTGYGELMRLSVGEFRAMRQAAVRVLEREIEARKNPE